jgi:hypothetical protein
MSDPPSRSHEPPDRWKAAILTEAVSGDEPCCGTRIAVTFVRKPFETAVPITRFCVSVNPVCALAWPSTESAKAMPVASNPSKPKDVMGRLVNQAVMSNWLDEEGPHSFTRYCVLLPRSVAEVEASGSPATRGDF